MSTIKYCVLRSAIQSKLYKNHGRSATVGRLCFANNVLSGLRDLQGRYCVVSLAW